MSHAIVPEGPYCVCQPDWRDPRQYPRPDDLDGHEWAWEFLRRRADYLAEHGVTDEPAWQAGDIRRYGAEVPYSECVARLFERGEDYWSVYPHRRYPTIDLAERYKIEPIAPHPHVPLPPHCCLMDEAYESARGPWPIDTDEERAAVRAMPGEIIDMAFDVHAPLERQLRIAYAWLLEARAASARLDPSPERAGGRKIQRNKLPLYLRLLDAEAAGASPAEMAAVFYPAESNSYPNRGTEKKLRYQRAVARALRDADYWRIPI